ncbi:MAG TPA: SDR family NAD(P)-dependent oxidoreductase [Terriglobales bacterium]|nr:SDR family NAD(P)-dependent oxidoreductase [Terriglobales bacterium]
MTFKDKVAIVAGGTGGLGRAVSQAFLAEGSKVIVTYRKKQEFDELKKTAGARASKLFGSDVDVTDHAAVQKFISTIAVENGRVDFLVNTVGAYAGGVRLWDIDPAVLDQQLKLNLISGYVLCRAAVPLMLKQKSGAIVSVASKAAADHAAGAAAYAASKAAAVAMMESLAADLKGSGVRVNSILPSIIDTAANRRTMPGADFTKWPKPKDIAKVILFLCSDDAGVIQGATIPVYGDS